MRSLVDGFAPAAAESSGRVSAIRHLLYRATIHLRIWLLLWLWLRLRSRKSSNSWGRSSWCSSRVCRQ